MPGSCKQTEVPSKRPNRGRIRHLLSQASGAEQRHYPSFHPEKLVETSTPNQSSPEIWGSGGGPSPPTLPSISLQPSPPMRGTRGAHPESWGRRHSGAPEPAGTPLLACSHSRQDWETAAPAAPLSTAITRGKLLAPSSRAMRVRAPLPFPSVASGIGRLAPGARVPGRGAPGRGLLMG